MSCLIVAGVLFVSATAAGQPSDDQIGEMATFFELFPRLRTLPAPEWLAPGVRASYSARGATTETGGAGFVQYDVVGRDAVRVVLDQHNYGDGGAGLLLLGQTGAVGVPGLGPFWMNPSVLDGAEQVGGGSLTVSRYDKEVAGQTRTVVRFQTETANGRTVYEFSAASGLLVFSSIGTQGSAAQLELLTMRALELPWAADAAPTWARIGAELEFAGTKTTTVSGAGSSEMAIAVDVSLAAGTATWSMFESVTTLENVGQSPNTTFTGVAQINGAIWLPRGATAATIPTEPTQIDVDPVTGAETFLVARDDLIVLQQELGGSILTWRYDSTLGVLEGQSIRTETPTAIEETELSRVGGSDLASLAEMGDLPGQLPDDDVGDGADPDDDDDGAEDGSDDAADDPDVDVSEDEGGCRTAGGPAGWLGFLVVMLAVGRGVARRPAGPIE